MQSKLGPTRIHSLDYLRGLAALGIMCYHMQLFSFGEADAATDLAKIKIYGVAVFYILSGLTLYNVYAAKFSLKATGSFYKKRVFRIVPLLLLATLLTLLLGPVQHFSGLKLLCNVAVLPGIIRPDVFIANGAWSIGNEMCFYLFFPVLLLLARQSKWYLWISIGISLLVFIFFSFVVLQPARPLGAQWAAYVNVSNQFFLFALGMGLASLKAPSDALKKTAPLGVVFMLLLFFGYHVSGEPVVLVTGFNRLVLTFYVAVLCYGIYITDFSFLPSLVKQGLHTLGNISYSVYLLHPVVYLLLKQLLGSTASPYVLIAATILLTLPLSYVVYNRFELYFVALGNKKLRLPILRLAFGKV